jgi:hypothetical protein
MTIIKIKVNNLPSYLKNSPLLSILSDGSDKKIKIQSKYFCKNIIINNIDDLIFIIRVLDFWQIDDTPYEIYDYVFKNIDLIESNFDLIKSEFNEKNNVICEMDIIIYKEYHAYDTDLCSNAANLGSLNLLKYLHVHEYPWCRGACMNAAGQGHLEVLKYLITNGCPWHVYCSMFAASEGHVNCLEYAHKNNYICYTNDELYDHAKGSGNLECIKYIQSRINSVKKL